MHPSPAPQPGYRQEPVPHPRLERPVGPILQPLRLPRPFQPSAHPPRPTHGTDERQRSRCPTAPSTPLRHNDQPCCILHSIPSDFIRRLAALQMPREAATPRSPSHRQDLHGPQDQQTRADISKVADQLFAFSVANNKLILGMTKDRVDSVNVRHMADVASVIARLQALEEAQKHFKAELSQYIEQQSSRMCIRDQIEQQQQAQIANLFRTVETLSAQLRNVRSSHDDLSARTEKAEGFIVALKQRQDEHKSAGASQQQLLKLQVPEEGHEAGAGRASLDAKDASDPVLASPPAAALRLTVSPRENAETSKDIIIRPDSAMEDTEEKDCSASSTSKIQPMTDFDDSVSSLTDLSDIEGVHDDNIASRRSSKSRLCSLLLPRRRRRIRIVSSETSSASSCQESDSDVPLRRGWKQRQTRQKSGRCRVPRLASSSSLETAATKVSPKVPASRPADQAPSESLGGSTSAGLAFSNRARQLVSLKSGYITRDTEATATLEPDSPRSAGLRVLASNQGFTLPDKVSDHGVLSPSSSVSGQGKPENASHAQRFTVHLGPRARDAGCQETPGTTQIRSRPSPSAAPHRLPQPLKVIVGPRSTEGYSRRGRQAPPQPTRRSTVEFQTLVAIENPLRAWSKPLPLAGVKRTSDYSA